MASVAQTCNTLGTSSGGRELGKLLLAVQADLAQIKVAYGLLVAKLDSNHGVASDHATTCPLGSLNVNP